MYSILLCQKLALQGSARLQLLGSWRGSWGKRTSRAAHGHHLKTEPHEGSGTYNRLTQEVLEEANAFATQTHNAVTMPAPTLQAVALRATMRNITNIYDIADMRYDLIKPALKKIKNPQQLREIEVNSPAIADQTEELWRAFIARDIPGWKEKIFEPVNPRSWWKVHAKLMRAEKRIQEQQEKALELALGGLKQEREERKVSILEKVVPEDRKRTTKAPVLRNAKSGNQVLAALRAQGRTEARNRRMDLGRLPRGAVAKISALPSAKEQIGSAPRWMVRDLMKPVLMAPPAPLFGNKTPVTAMVSRGGPSRQEIALRKAEQEAKLKRLTQARPQQQQQGRAMVGTTVSPPPAAKSGESMAEREARLKALTQGKARPAQVVGARPTPKSASSPVREHAVAKAIGIASPDPKPSPVLEATRKRPAPSPMMPMKRRKIM
ncbi:hypothetical protein LTR86_006792 [Recurvomyces mirabilis]|nr:hypothetical protein LTR86_006792 [Recurvomyces mirabilis]